MKFKFSFQKVLEFKENEKDIAAEEYNTIQIRQMELQEQIDGLELVKEKAFDQYNDVHRKTIWEILEVQQGIDHVNRQVRMLEFQSQKIQQEAEHKHQVLIEKSKEAKMWNQWKEKSKDAFQRQLEQKEQAMLDEMAVLRFARRI